MTEKEILALRIKLLTGWNINPYRLKIVTDTSDWMNINRGDIIRIGGRDYVIRGNMREPRFGIDDQPKYWVFTAIDMVSGNEKIIKAVFNEEFNVHIGFLKIRCYRSPEKESQVLDLVRGDNRFMQGFTFPDDKNNPVRIIDYIRGQSYFHLIPSIQKTHEEFFFTELPLILTKLKECFTAIIFLHKNGLCHGDIRNDHIIVEADTGMYRWIDFDLKQDVSDFDLWSFGNILSYTVGKGIRTFDSVLKSKEISDEIKISLATNDASAFYTYRIMNLKKIYPYITDRLSRLLGHFCVKPIAYYATAEEFYVDFCEMLDSDFPVH